MSSSTDAKEGTGRERVESWKSGWNMFLHNPLGVGGGNFPVRFSEYQTSYFTRYMWGRQAHSLWFTLIPEQGVFGIAIYAWLFIVNIKHIFRLRKYSSIFEDREVIFLRNLSVAFIASLAGYFISATFISVLYYGHYWYLTAIIASANIIVTEKMNELESNDLSVA
jgi:O-antigen ligase